MVRLDEGEPSDVGASGAPYFTTDSPLEIDFWLEWYTQALDLVYPLTPQYSVKGGQYRLDFAYPPLSVGIELDGYTYHSDVDAFTRDRQRDRELSALGWHLRHFSGEELRGDIVKCVYEAAHHIDVIKHRKDAHHAPSHHARLGVDDCRREAPARAPRPAATT